MSSIETKKLFMNKAIKNTRDQILPWYSPDFTEMQKKKKKYFNAIFTPCIYQT